MRSILRFIILLMCALHLSPSLAESNPIDRYRYPFYLGLTGGYGTTTWEGLVPSGKNQNQAMILSTPTVVTEGGAIWGAQAGYEFNPFFAVELSYIRYPNAKVLFDEASIYTFEQNLDSLNTHTETFSLMAKVMMLIPRTYTRAYTSAGVAAVRRDDRLKNHWRGSPTFGLGFNRNFSDHAMVELGGVYTAGYGESQLNPTQSYYPFLYSFFVRLAYRF